MDGIKQQIHARQSEALETKHQHELRKNNREMRGELNSLKDQNKSAIVEVKKDYERSLLQEQNQTEQKLTRIRSSNKRIIKSEEQRFKQMIEEIKMGHQDKIAELKVSQEKEYEDRLEKHNSALEKARDKYMTNLKKYDS